MTHTTSDLLDQVMDVSQTSIKTKKNTIDDQ